MTPKSLRDVFLRWSEDLSTSAKAAMLTISQHDVRALENIAEPYLEMQRGSAVARVATRLGLLRAAGLDAVLAAVDGLLDLTLVRDAIPKGMAPADVIAVLREARPAWFAPVWCRVCGHKDVLESALVATRAAHPSRTTAELDCPACGAVGMLPGERPHQIAPLGDLIGVDTNAIRKLRSANGFDDAGQLDDVPF